MSKYRVLWIDDKYKEMSLLIKNWKVNPEIDIEVIGYEYAVDGMSAFDAAPDTWDAVLLDAQQLYDNNEDGTSVLGLRECRDFFKNHAHKVPYFIFTGDAKCKSDKDFAILMGQRVYKKGNEQDEKDLVRDIHNAVEANPKRKMREKYAAEIAICNKYAQEIIEIALLIDNNQTNDAKVFNTMRDILEWVVKYGREHGAFNQFVATPANAASFIQLIKNPEIAPSYVVTGFCNCNEVVQNGSHGEDAGEAIKVKKHVREGLAPHLIESTFHSLIVILDWCGTFPKSEDGIAAWREITDPIKLQQEPLEGIVQQDEHNNFYCTEESEERSCLINYRYAQENNLLGKRVRIMSMIANTRYPEESPYPFYTARNVIVLQ